MKKLLTILGAVGLTATTGATVVACGNPDKATKSDFKVYLDDTELEKDKTATLLIQDFDKLSNLEDFKVVFDNNKQDNVSAEKFTNNKNTVKITALKEGTVSFHVEATVKKETSIYADKAEVKKSDTVSLTVVKSKFDISHDIELPIAGTPAAGKSLVKTAIGTMISAAAPGAVETTDYTVTFKNDKNDPVLAGDTIEVKSVTTSKLITGSFTITITDAK